MLPLLLLLITCIAGWSDEPLEKVAGPVAIVEDNLIDFQSLEQCWTALNPILDPYIYAEDSKDVVLQKKEAQRLQALLPGDIFIGNSGYNNSDSDINHNYHYRALVVIDKNPAGKDYLVHAIQERSNRDRNNPCFRPGIQRTFRTSGMTKSCGLKKSKTDIILPLGGTCTGISFEKRELSKNHMVIKSYRVGVQAGEHPRVCDRMYAKPLAVYKASHHDNSVEIRDRKSIIERALMRKIQFLSTHWTHFTDANEYTSLNRGSLEFALKQGGYCEKTFKTAPSTELVNKMKQLHCKNMAGKEDPLCSQSTSPPHTPVGT